MNIIKKASNARRHLEVTPYDFSNELLNKIHDGETVWIVNGSVGRKPIIADTAEEAAEDYLDRFYEEEEEESNED